VFWLDEDRAHDANLIAKVQAYLADHDTDGLQIEIMAPATRSRSRSSGSARARTPSRCTGNVLRDYLTDLFPILELGTSAKMLSVVPLINGGGLFETGAGGSAPKHVQQLVKENHLRWDSLGEFLALAASFEHLARPPTTRGADPGRHPRPRHRHVPRREQVARRKVGEIDNRGSHFYLALFWAEELASQSDDTELARRSPSWPAAARRTRTPSTPSCSACRARPADIGGYYRPDSAKAEAVMRPSRTLNETLAILG
jgi:isocitrate dehydrogenase